MTTRQFKTAILIGSSGIGTMAGVLAARETTRAAAENKHMQELVDMGEFVCENHPDKLWPNECDCGAGMPRQGTRYAMPSDAPLWPNGADNALVNVDLAEVEQHAIMAEQDAVEQEPARPEGMPEGTPSWRENVARLAPAVAVSPLPTRQLKRMAAKSLAKTLSSVAKIQERKDRLQAKKRARADAAVARHKKIAEHVPTKA